LPSMHEVLGSSPAPQKIEQETGIGRKYVNSCIIPFGLGV
jgi:hypothetical protein